MELVSDSAPKFRSGLTWRSLLAVLYSMFTFTAARLFLALTTVGAPGLTSAIEFSTLFIFVELTYLTGNRLTKEEATLVFGLAAIEWSFLGLIYNAYYVRSPILISLGIDPAAIPTWFAPRYDSGAFESRTFFHPAWFTPMIANFGGVLLGIAGGLFFGLMGRELFIESEKLPFPIQHINASIVITLSERKKSQFHILSFSTILAFMYGLLLYGIPISTRAAGYPVEFLPIPWFDFTHVIERILPGASFGIATDITLVAMGLVLPTWIVIGIFIGSLARFCIVSPISVLIGWSTWAERWVPGMDFIRIFQDSTLYFWVNPLIGMGLAAGFVPAMLKWRMLVSSLKSIFFPDKAKMKERVSGDPFPRSFMVILFAVGILGAIALDLWLVPDFPLVFLLTYEMLFPFLLTLLSTRMMGVVGMGIDVPYLNSLMITASGYGKIDAWFLPFTLNPGTSWTSSFKICQLTGTTTRSYVKMYVLMIPLSMLVGLIYMEILWKLAPIPSSMFPSADIIWPIWILNSAIWITRPAGYFDLNMILGSFALFGGLTAVLMTLKTPISMLSIIAGFSTPIPSAFTIFTGLLVRTFIERSVGTETFRQYRNTISAGIMLGEGMAIVLGIAISIIERSVWMAPF